MNGIVSVIYAGDAMPSAANTFEASLMLRDNACFVWYQASLLPHHLNPSPYRPDLDQTRQGSSAAARNNELFFTQAYVL